MESRRRPARRRRESGFSLVETLCVSTTLTVAVLGMTQVAVTATTLHQVGVQKAAAIEQVEEELGTILSTDFEDVAATHHLRGFGVRLDGATNDAFRAIAGDADGQPGLVTVSAPTGNAAELLEVRVRLDWIGVNGPQHLERVQRLSRLGAGS
jgi:hypothetical protein